MEFSETPEFTKEFKKLQKKYRTLTEDISVLKKLLVVNPNGNSSKHWNRLCTDETMGVTVLKVRMMCRAVHGSQFRVTYAYQAQEVTVLFIEIYFKGNKENKDTIRVQNYFELVKGQVRKAAGDSI